MAKKQSTTTQQSATPVASTQQSTPAPAPVQQAATTPAPEKKARAPSKKAEQAQPAPTQQSSTPASAPTQQAAVTPAPAEKKARASSKKAEKQESTPAQVAPVSSQSSTEASAEQSHDEQQTVDSLFQSLASQVEALVETQKTLLTTLRRAVKLYNRESREMARTNARLAAKRARRQGGDGTKRAPSGFQIPSSISDALCDFLGVPHGTKKSRNEVTKQINAYIREKNLQVQENRRSFVPDNKLSAILGKLQDVDASSGFTYFNLQRYISRHFTPNTPATASSSQ